MRRWQIAALLALALLAGCVGVARQKTEFYLLEALADPAPISKLQGDAWLGLGPVTLARYLDRPQMVTRSGPGRVRLAELHQWAEPLQENIAQVLRDNLARLLGSERLVALPGRGLPPLGWQLEVDILRLDAGPGPEAWLEARWRLLDADGLLESIGFLHVFLIVRIRKGSNGQEHVSRADLLFCQGACLGTVEPPDRMILVHDHQGQAAVAAASPGR